MEDLNRRSALALGLTITATSLIAWPTSAAAQAYGPNDGNELFPGVRAVALGERPSMMSAYATVEMVDVVFQPGAVFPLGEPMEHDMVCHASQGELLVKQNNMEFVVGPGGVWNCGKGSTTEGATNNGSTVAVMRIIFLKAA